MLWFNEKKPLRNAIQIKILIRIKQWNCVFFSRSLSLFTYFVFSFFVLHQNVNTPHLYTLAILNSFYRCRKKKHELLNKILYQFLRLYIYSATAIAVALRFVSFIFLLCVGWKYSYISLFFLSVIHFINNL